jgi:hypothetical protein
MHLLVEAADERSLARGMNGLGVRVAKGLNKVMGRSGKVLEERYHGHILRTPTEVRNARGYLSTNAKRHIALEGEDPYASRHPLVQPETFLMRLVC